MDGVIPVGGYIHVEDLMAGLGLPRQVFDALPAPGGNAAVYALRLASDLIGTGRPRPCSSCWPGTGHRRTASTTGHQLLPGQQFRTQLERAARVERSRQWYAMICRRHMAEFGTTKEQLARVALERRSMPRHNPRADAARQDR